MEQGNGREDGSNRVVRRKKVMEKDEGRDVRGWEKRSILRGEKNKQRDRNKV